MTTGLGTAAIAGAAAVIGVLCGALLNRRNEKQAEADRLLVSALNDAMIAIAEVAQGGGREALARYASAKARIALRIADSCDCLPPVSRRRQYRYR